MILQEIAEKLQAGKANDVAALVTQAIEEKIAPEVILNEGLLSGMSVISEKFKAGEIFVPNVLIAARAMNKGTEILKPLLVGENAQTKGRVCIGTVEGDLHDIGKNLCKMMMEGKGLEVIDLGTDVSPDKFVETAVKENCQIICCSALLTTTMPTMRAVVEKCREAGIRDKVRIMIGGAPVSKEFCAEIGADAYTQDAATCSDYAAEFCRELL